MTLFRKLRLNRIRLQISNLASHTSHPPQNQTTPVSPNHTLLLTRNSITTTPTIHLPKTRSITQIRTRVLANQVSNFLCTNTHDSYYNPLGAAIQTMSRQPGVAVLPLRSAQHWIKTKHLYRFIETVLMSGFPYSKKRHPLGQRRVAVLR